MRKPINQYWADISHSVFLAVRFFLSLLSFKIGRTSFLCSKSWMKHYHLEAVLYPGALLTYDNYEVDTSKQKMLCHFHPSLQ